MRRRDDVRRARELWQARDAHQTENGILGVLGLMLLGLVMAIGALFAR
jgi:hypothetical protein